MKNTFEQFIDENYPNLRNYHKIDEMTDEELLGKIVYSNRSGFSCGNEGGTEMLIDSINSRQVHFSPTEDSKHLTSTGWICDRDKLFQSIRLTKGK